MSQKKPCDRKGVWKIHSELKTFGYSWFRNRRNTTVSVWFKLLFLFHKGIARNILFLERVCSEQESEKAAGHISRFSFRLPRNWRVERGKLTFRRTTRHRALILNSERKTGSARHACSTSAKTCKWPRVNIGCTNEETKKFGVSCGQADRFRSEVC